MKTSASTTSRQPRVASFAGIADARRRDLLQQLVQHLHAYAKATEAHARGVARRAGLPAPGRRHQQRQPQRVLAPVRRAGAVQPGGSARQRSWGHAGQRARPVPYRGLALVRQSGRPDWRQPRREWYCCAAGCSTRSGQPLPGATLDFWQNAANGLYWQMDPAQPQDNLRCQMRVDAAGCFAIRTIRPRPYQIPTDGPVWHDLVEPAGRSAWRPAHLPPDRRGAWPAHAGHRALRRRRPVPRQRRRVRRARGAGAALRACGRRRRAGDGHRPRARHPDALRHGRRAPQSACLRRNAGISISSMPLLASASTLAAAWLRALRQTLGVLSPV